MHKIFGVFGQKLLLRCKGDGLTLSSGSFPGRESCKLQTPNLCLQIFPASQGATPHSPPMITAAVRIIKTGFLHFYLISLARCLPQQLVSPWLCPVQLLGGDTDLLPPWSHRASLSLTPPSRFEIRLRSPRAFTTPRFSVFTHQKLQ